MAKLTKDEVKRHNEALRLLEKDKLTYDEKVYVYENWNEGAESMNSKYGAFFTPFDFARDFNLEVFYGSDRKIIDLCAGIGMLSFVAYHHCAKDEHPQITCIELNKDYAEVGKKLLPEANWIVGSVTDKALIESLGHYDQCISNPPFGKITQSENVKDWLKYKGGEFEFKVMEIAGKISDYGTFIVPQGSTPFKYSGAPFYVDYQNPCENDYGSMPMKVQKFINETGYSFLFNIGIDTKTYIDQWKGVSPICEVISIDYSGKHY